MSCSSVPGAWMAIRRAVGADVEEPGRAARDFGQVDFLAVRQEVRSLDGLKIGKIVDQREQVASGGRDVARIIGVVLTNEGRSPVR